nr:hypothetical protein CFP56_18162 [Quercus suber]
MAKDQPVRLVMDFSKNTFVAVGDSDKRDEFENVTLGECDEIKIGMQDTLSTNGQKTPTSIASIGDGIAATTSAVFVTETTTSAGEARVAAISAGDSIAAVASAEDSNSKDASQEEEQTLEDLRTYC